VAAPIALAGHAELSLSCDTSLENQSAASLGEPSTISLNYQFGFMNLKSLTTRVNRVTKFVCQAGSLSAVPILAVAAIARDNPFGNTGSLSSAVGRFVGVIKVRTRATEGQFALIDTHDLGDLISCEEVLIDKTYNLSMVPFQPDVIVDCGAHIGLFTLIAGLRFASAELFAYEPNARNLRKAKEQLARFSDRVHLVDGAVSTENGESWFGADESNSGRLSDDPFPAGRRVRTINLLDQSSRWAGRRLLLKMDIEGAERKVLPHVIGHLPSQSAIFFEVHGGQDVWVELSNMATSAGFQVIMTRRRMPYFDGFAVRQ
jgi:FkbM family methyltransferase